MQRSSGHRTHPHTADTILEAWGPDLASCLTEVGRGLVEGFARVPAAATASTDWQSIVVTAPDPERLVAAWLNELLFTVDVAGVVPARIEVISAEPKACTARYVPVAVEEATQVGAVPKSVSLSGLTVSADPDGYHCQVLIDV